MIVGIDEVGRGCLAGPVCVAAVAWDADVAEVADSKRLSAARRATLAGTIKRQARLIGIGWADRGYIDTHGIVVALKYAAERALTPFGGFPELILLDGNHNYLEDSRVVTIVGGDGEVPVISAASIVAKVARDRYMLAAARRFPGYGFEKHVGYLTAAHQAALAALGPCALHRLSFAPLKERVNVN